MPSSTRLPDMATRSKPNFSSQLGVWLNPQHLPAEILGWLEMHIAESGLDPAQRERFVAYASQLAQMPQGDDEPMAEQLQRIEKIQSDARRLLASINGLGESAAATLAMYTREACLVPESPIPPDMVERIAALERMGFLEQTWEWVNALEATAGYVRSRQEASRQDKPKQARARALVANLASFHVQLTGTIRPGDKTAPRFSPDWCDTRLPGTAPPKDSAAWFAQFVKCLGEHMGLEVGPRIVRSGIEMATAPEEAPESQD